MRPISMPVNNHLLFTTFSGSLALAIIFLYVYLQDKAKYLFIWLIGWGVYLISLGIQLARLTSPENSLLLAAWLVVLWAAFSLMYCAIQTLLYEQISQKVRGTLLIGGGFLAVCALVGTGANSGDFSDWRSPLLAGLGLLPGALLIGIGWEVQKLRFISGYGRLITSLSFSAWGGLVILFPILQSLPEFPAWWLSVSAILAFISPLWLGLSYFELTRDQLKRKNAQLENLLQAASQLTSSLELKGVLESIGRSAVEILNAYSCTIYMLAEDGRRLTPVVAIDPQYEEEVLAAELDVEASLTGQAVLQRRSLIFNDPVNAPNMFQVPGTPVEAEERLIVAPFRDGELILGVLCLARMGIQFTQEDLALAETFAAYASTALKNARSHLNLQREVHERLRVLQALRESESRYRELFEGSPISLWEVDFSRVLDWIEARRQEGISDLIAYCHEHLEAQVDLLQKVAVLNVNQATLDMFGFKDLEELRKNPAKIITPEFMKIVCDSLKTILEGGNYFESETLIQNFNQELLYVSLKWKTAPGYEGNYERVQVSFLDITQQMLAQTAIEREAFQQARLLETARHLAESLDLREVLERIGAGIRELISADGCTIYLLSEDGRELNPMVVVDPYYSAQILASPLEVEGSLTGQAVIQQRGLIFNDAVNSGIGIQIPGTPVDEQENVIVAPFMVEGEVLGAMCLDRTGAIFTQEDLALAMMFAAYASSALKNARAHSKLAEANEALQREIEERQQTENALRQAHAALAEGEERYRTLFEDSPISLWDEDFSQVKLRLDELRNSGVTDFRTYFDQHPDELVKAINLIRVVAVNRATVRLFEAENAEDLLKDLSRITIDDSFEGMKESILAVAGGAKQFEYETSNCTLTGKRIDVHLHWTVAPGCEESYEKLLLSIVDITERRRAHVALQVSESRFRGLFEDSPVSLWEEDFSGVKEIVDQIREREGYPTPGVEELRDYFLTHPEDLHRCSASIQVLDVNPATLELYRAKDRSELIGSLEKILNSTGCDANLHEILAIAGGDQECEFESQNLTIDGEPIWVSLKWSVASGYEESYARVLVSIVDITARKQAEEAMHKAHQALAEANQALQQKTHTLERLLETARQLTSSLDVKQVLESIGQGALEILESYSCSIFMLDDSGKKLTPVVVIDPDYQEEMLAVVVDVEASLTGQAVLQRRSLIFNDPVGTPVNFQIPGTPVEDEERIIVAPFIDGEQVLGAMCIARMGTHYTNEDLALAETFAAYASSALRNARAHANLSEAHEALQESEERYRSLFEDNQSVMLLIDPESMRIVDANPSACRFYGHEREQLVERKITEIPIIDEVEAGQTLAISSNGRCGHFMSVHRVAGGEVHPVEIYSSQIRMDGRTLLYVIVHDITERVQRERELETIVRVASALRSAQTRSEMLPVILQQLSELLHAEGAALAMRDVHSGETVFELGIGTAQKLTGTRLPGKTGITGNVIATGQPFISNVSPTEDPPHNGSTEKQEHPAMAAVPLIAQDQTIGALVIGRNTPISEAEMRLFNAVGEMAANAIYRETLNEETQQYANNMGAVSAIGRSLAETLEPAEVYERMVDSILDLFPGTAGVLISRFDPLRNCILPEYGVEDEKRLYASDLPASTILDQGDDPQSWVVRNLKPLIAPDRPGKELTVLQRSGAALYVPLQAKGEILGVIQLHSHIPNHYTNKDADLLTVIGQIGAIAIQNARLFQEIQRRVSRLDAQHSIDKAITGSFNLEVTLALVVEQMTRHLDVDAADVLLFDPLTQTLKYAAGAGFRTNALTPTSLRLGKGFAGRVALERRMVAITDMRAHIEKLKPDSVGEINLRATLSNLQAEGFQAYFGMPLIAKGQIKGVLELYKRTTFEPDSEWLSFLDALAYQSAIAIDNTTLFYDLQHSNRELTLTIDTTLEGWARALELRDIETKNHSQRVVEETVKVARAMGLDGDTLMHIRRGALLHDIGKMGIPDQILNKPGPLTPEEWEVMKQHPVHAFKLLSSIPFLRPALDIPYAHHERWDGSGYPRGLKGEEIPIAARIFAVVDVWDALLNDRPYRPPWPADKVRAYMKEQAGKQFDPRVVDLFLRLEKSMD